MSLTCSWKFIPSCSNWCSLKRKEEKEESENKESEEDDATKIVLLVVKQNGAWKITIDKRA